MTSPRVSKIEQELSLKLPQDYATFIDTQGVATKNGILIYGYNEDIKDINKTPCVIGATKSYTDYKIKQGDLVIAQVGYEDLIYVLESSTGKIFEVGFDGKRKFVFESFSDLMAYIERQ